MAPQLLHLRWNLLGDLYTRLERFLTAHSLAVHYSRV